MGKIKTFKNFNDGIFEYFINDDIESIKNYIESGYDLNTQDNIGHYTALIYAAKNNKIKITKLLLNAGADLNLKDFDGHTALTRAAQNNNIGIVKLLLNSGVDFNEKDNNGNTALIWAISNNNIEIVKLLLNAGIDFNNQNDDGNTALLIAATGDNYEIIKLLLDFGADIDKQSVGGYTPLIAAACNDNKKNIELLLDYHADEFILDKYNNTFFYYLNSENQEYFLKEYPNKVYNAILHWYKKPFTEFVKDFKLKII